ncbi:MAG: plasmid recombination protein [Methylotenera sp.]|nr:plasmid recombination protein [Methylotenera sp.]MDD4926129.1 plasmid recombination protein [Methylotenera sp.]
MGELGGGFIRIETFSKTVAKNAKGKTSAGAVIAEATRQEGFTSHIDDVVAPTLLYGIDPTEAYNEAMARLEVERDDKGRKIRSTATVLLGGVASFPKPRVAITDEDKEVIEEWKARTIAFLKLEFGDNLRSVVEHHDEGYPHIHFYIIGDKVAETRKLHPGARAEIGIADKSERLAAYGKGLRTFQDDYYNNVSAFVGMTRIGPFGYGNSKKVSRPTWKRDKHVAKVMAERLKDADLNWAESKKNLNDSLDELDALLEQQAEVRKEHAEIEKTISKRVRQRVNEILARVEKEYDEKMGQLVYLADSLTTALSKAKKEAVKEIEADSGVIVAEAIVSNYKKAKGLK